MRTRWWLLGLAACLLVAGLSPLASAAPDGLERVADDGGFTGRALSTPFKLAADYLFPGIENEALATALAGIAGTLVLFGLAYGLAWWLKSGRQSP